MRVECFQYGLCSETIIIVLDLRFTRNRCPIYILEGIDHFTTPSSSWVPSSLVFLGWSPNKNSLTNEFPVILCLYLGVSVMSWCEEYRCQILEGALLLAYLVCKFPKFGKGLATGTLFEHLEGILVECPGRVLGILCQNPSISKSNQLHVEIFQFSLINLKYNSWISLKRFITLLKSRASTNYFSNSTSSSITALNVVFSVTYYLNLHIAISFYHWCNFVLSTAVNVL